MLHNIGLDLPYICPYSIPALYLAHCQHFLKKLIRICNFLNYYANKTGITLGDINEYRLYK